MKVHYLLAIAILFTKSISAQNWSGTTPGKIYYNQGNVGIGTTNPGYHLHTVGSDRARFEQTNGTIDIVAYGASGNDYDNTAGLFASNKSALVMTGLSGSGDIKFITRPSGYSERMIIKNNGNIGIGVASPSALLQVGDGNVFLNANDPDNAGLRFFFDKSTYNNGADVDLTIRTNGGSPIVDWNIRNWSGSYTFNRQMSNGAGGEQTRNLFRIETNGNIVVPQGNAIIDGKVSSEEVKVEVLDVPDYVFEPGYELRTLKETKRYIAQNKHLPEIPSAKEIESNGGVELGDMNMRLLKKIEELTLYQIQLMEEMEAMKKELQELKK